MGRRSKKSLSRLAFGKDARSDCHTRDRYDRNVCRAFVDKLDLSAARVELGMAWSFRTYANEQEAQARLLYEELEERVRAVGTGLWAEENPVPPREWRSAHANRLRAEGR